MPSVARWNYSCRASSSWRSQNQNCFRFVARPCARLRRKSGTEPIAIVLATVGPYVFFHATFCDWDVGPVVLGFCCCLPEGGARRAPRAQAGTASGVPKISWRSGSVPSLSSAAGQRGGVRSLRGYRKEASVAVGREAAEADTASARCRAKSRSNWAASAPNLPRTSTPTTTRATAHLAKLGVSVAALALGGGLNCQARLHIRTWMSLASLRAAR